MRGALQGRVITSFSCKRKTPLSGCTVGAVHGDVRCANILVRRATDGNARQYEVRFIDFDWCVATDVMSTP